MTGITSDRRGPVPPPSFELSNLDAVRWLQDQPSESIDLLITDPAYESLEKHRAVGTTTRLKHSKASSNDWFRIFPNARFGELFGEAYRVLRRHTHFYLLCAVERMLRGKTAAQPERQLSRSMRTWSYVKLTQMSGQDTQCSPDL